MGTAGSGGGCLLEIVVGAGGVSGDTDSPEAVGDVIMTSGRGVGGRASRAVLAVGGTASRGGAVSLFAGSTAAGGGAGKSQGRGTYETGR